MDQGWLILLVSALVVGVTVLLAVAHANRHGSRGTGSTSSDGAGFDLGDLFEDCDLFEVLCGIFTAFTDDD